MELVMKGDKTGKMVDYAPQNVPNWCLDGKINQTPEKTKDELIADAKEEIFHHENMIAMCELKIKELKRYIKKLSK